MLLVLGTVPSAHAQELFDARFRSALQGSSDTGAVMQAPPPMGSSEQLEVQQTEQPATQNNAPQQSEPYIDLTNGLVAAGGAALAAFTIIFLFLLVIKSRHHELS